MKKLGKFKLFGMVAILTVALIFLGINYLEADKPDKPDKPGKGPQWEWTAAIPGSNVYSDCNLFGLPNGSSYNIYQNKEKPGRVDVTVEKKKGGKTGETLFRLTIWLSVDDASGTCLSGPKVGFQNLALTQVGEIAYDEFPCFLPNFKALTGECYPEDPWDVSPWIPGCMKDFLENYDQPFCDTGCVIYNSSCSSDVPNCIYRYVDIMITVDYDIEKIQVGHSEMPTAQVWVKVVNNFDLQTGLEDWHNISSLLKRDNSEGCITVTRLDIDTWEVTIDGVFTFNEIYKGHWRNRWEYKIPYWAQTPLKFITKWTRQPVE